MEKIHDEETDCHQRDIVISKYFVLMGAVFKKNTRLLQKRWLKTIQHSKRFRIFALVNNVFMPMTTQEMTQLIADYFKTQPVLKAWLFGSFSRGEEREGSDVDIMIQLDRTRPVGLFKLSGMHLDLQDLLGLPVDLVTDKGLMDFARPSVDHDKILIYERAA